MNMRPSPQDSHQNVESRIRTLRILWFALLMTVVLYFLLTLFVGTTENATPNSTLSLTLGGVALLTTLISFPVKNKFFARSVEEQKVQLVQQGLIIALALNEVTALLGVLDFFATGDRYYYVLFLIAAIGQLLHFPRRQHVLDASFKNPGF